HRHRGGRPGRERGPQVRLRGVAAEPAAVARADVDVELHDVPGPPSGRARAHGGRAHAHGRDAQRHARDDALDRRDPREPPAGRRVGARARGAAPVPRRAGGADAVTADGGRLVALDLDGTLLDWTGRIMPGVPEAVQALRDAGDHVVISTGRSVVSMLPIAHGLGLDRGPAVTSNGAVRVELWPGPADGVRDDGVAHGAPLGGAWPGYTIRDLVTFDPGPALRVVRDELPDALFAVEDVGRGFFVTEEFPPGEIDGETTFVDFEQLCALAATRVVIRSPEHTDADFHEMVERIGLHEVSYAVGWTAWLDLSPKGRSEE